jgi:hypothetical protein
MFPKQEVAKQQQEFVYRLERRQPPDQQPDDARQHDVDRLHRDRSI